MRTEVLVVFETLVLAILPVEVDESRAELTVVVRSRVERRGASLLRFCRRLVTAGAILFFSLS